MARIRADAALVAAGLFPSREQAKAAIMAGRVSAGGERVDKAGRQVPADVVFEVSAWPEYVSRGGHKLAGALDVLGVDVRGLTVLDVGASTGGFTDCVLKRGASAVTALDVGYGQLAWSLRNDDRVRVLERTNIRDVQGELDGAPFDLAVVDVSFVGLAKVLPHVRTVLKEGGQVLALVKPQFEAGKGRVGKKGVVREPGAHAEILSRVTADLADQGWSARGLTWSPIKGPEGNIEFWLRLSATGAPSSVDVPKTVAAAHAALGG